MSKPVLFDQVDTPDEVAKTFNKVLAEIEQLKNEINDLNSLVSDLREKRDKEQAKADAKMQAELARIAAAEVRKQEIDAAWKLVEQAEARKKAEAEAKAKAEAEAKLKAEALAAAKKLLKETE